MSNSSEKPDEQPAILGGQPAWTAVPPKRKPFRDIAVGKALQAAVDNQSWCQYHGPNSESLTDWMKSFHACQHVVLCASGTVAVELALRGLRVGPGDEVIMAAYEFEGNIKNVLAVGAVPVLVDIAPDNWNMDVSQIEAALSPRTKAILVSHLHTGVVPMPVVKAISQQHDIPVIEDACQMPGALIYGERAGTWGDVGIWSFGGSKLLTAGRGGALFTNRDDVVARVKVHSFRGNDAYPLSELQAAVLLPQVEKLDSNNLSRYGLVTVLRNMLPASSGLTMFRNTWRDQRDGKLVEPPATTLPGCYKVGLQYDPTLFEGLPRWAFVEALRCEGVNINAGFRAVHCIHSRRRYRAVGELPLATRADSHVLTLHHTVFGDQTAQLHCIIRALDKVRRSARMIKEHLDLTDSSPN